MSSNVNDSNTLSHWKKAKVAGRIAWTPGLFTLQVEAPDLRFTAGQFASLALPALDDGGEPMVARPYSFANAPSRVSPSSPHEFLIVEVPHGPLSPRLARLREGDDIWIGSAHGFFVCDEIPAAKTLWMIATGTGVAPFLSMLHTEELWSKFEHVVLLYGVRHACELAYQPAIVNILKKRGAHFSYQAFVSRESCEGIEHAHQGRITAGFASGLLEKSLGRTVTPEASQIMLCGNPAMVDEVNALMAERGLRRHRKRAPGQITVEAYW